MERTMFAGHRYPETGKDCHMGKNHDRENVLGPGICETSRLGRS